jgi:hypothetical protein
MAIVYLDSSGKTRQVKVDGWYNALEKGNWGRYGSWLMMNLNMSTLETVITDESRYFGDGYWYGWHIRYS